MGLSASARLEELHADLLALIAEPEAATVPDSPDRNQLASVRWRLSRASRARTRLIEAVILPHLRSYAMLAEQDSLRALSAQIAAASTGSSQHVTSWTIDRVLAEWDDYRAASAAIRDAMRRRIAAEKSALQPPLRRYLLAANSAVDLPEAGTA